MTSRSSKRQTRGPRLAAPMWLCIAAISGFAATARAQFSAIPFVEEFSYTNNSELAGENGWTVFNGGVTHGILPDEFHGWLGRPGGSATAQDEEGSVGGVTLENWFGDFTAKPGVSGSYDKETHFKVMFEYTPPSGAIPAREPTIWSKYGNMFGGPRWNTTTRDDYYKMMTCVRWFVKTNGLISAYDGYFREDLTHAPITSSSWFEVECDYTNQVWSLTVNGENVVSNFALYATHKGATMLEDGWYKDYDGLKRIRFIDTAPDAEVSSRIDTIGMLLADDPTPLVSFAIGSSSGMEDVYSVTGNVFLGKSSAVDVDVDVQVTGGTASGGSDYNFTPLHLTFAPGETNQTFSFDVLNDLANEGDETIGFELLNLTNCIAGQFSKYTFTIVDLEDLPPTVNFAPATGAGTEEAAAAAATVILSHQYSGTVVVEHQLATPSGTATPGPDFSYTPGSLTFLSGETSHDINFTILDDSGDEGNETVVLELGTLSNAVAGADDSFTYTIVEDADMFTIPFVEPFEARVLGELNGQHGWVAGGADVQTNDVFEGARAAGLRNAYGRIKHTFSDAQTSVWTDHRSKPVFSAGGQVPPDGSTTAYYVSTNSNVIVFDGTTPLDSGISVTEGEWTRFTLYSDYVTKQWYIWVDGVMAGPFGFYDATVASFSEFSITEGDSGTAEAVLSYVDDIAVSVDKLLEGVPRVGFSVASASGEESVDPAITLMLNVWHSQTATVDYVATAASTATSPDDYTSATGTVTFLPGEISKAFTLDVVDDLLWESGGETILLALTNFVECEPFGMTNFNYTITDADDTWESVSFSTPTAAGTEETSVVTGSVVLAGSAPIEVSVDCELVVAGGTATEGSDFSYTPARLTFTPGDTAEVFVFTVIDDLAYEGAETIVFELRNLTNSLAGPYMTFTYTIDDIFDTPPTVAFSPITASAPESSATGTATMLLSHAYSGVVTVDYAVEAASSASAGQDFMYAGEPVVFSAGQTTNGFAFTVIDDVEEESDEEILFVISSVDNGETGVLSNFTYTILADPTDVPPTVSFAPASASGPEDAAAADASVTLSHVHSRVVTVMHSLATPPGTAVNGHDYTYSGGIVTFAPGETNQIVTVSVIDDGVREEDETFVLQLLDVTNGVLGVASNFTYTILTDSSDWSVPFYEPFEERTPGDLNGQYDWTAADVVVQTNMTFGGSAKAAAITNLNGSLSHTFTDGKTGVWTDLRTRAVYTRGTPPIPADATVAYFVATNGTVMVFDGTNAVATAGTVAEGEWARFTTFADYNTSTWRLFVNGSPAGDFGFFSTTFGVFTELSVYGESTYVDDIAVTTTKPLVEPATLVIVR